MNQLHKEILTAIDERIKIFFKDLDFDKTYYAKVISITDGYLAILNVNGATVEARIKEGLNIEVGDVVLAKSPNNNFSYLYVDGKLIKKEE